MMNMILFGSMIWIPVLIAYMLINEAKFKKNIVIGVTLPKEAREDEKVLSILDTFKKTGNPDLRHPHGAGRAVHDLCEEVFDDSFHDLDTHVHRGFGHSRCSDHGLLRRGGNTGCRTGLCDA